MAVNSVLCALWLRKQGLKPADIVFTCTFNAMYSYIPVLATFYIGASHLFVKKSIHVGWYHTADFGYYEESGLGYILGRLKNTLMVQINGNSVPLWKTDRVLQLIYKIIEVSILSDLVISDHPKIFAFLALMKESKL
ncbi:uncharacterized protein LOC117180586 [Belonocnema kinseyi]|uniref:uncharacterized protein LOC117180586 n=1 Tax=Belonocnema kinseyi TaxID=2817044 RepID=UPI00143D8D49|nr:uncharacterized protein LOC117180586 [Belonocnema kinseyi]